jgi:hypothetical protein
MACGSKDEVHPQILDREPPPAEWKEASSCPPEAPKPLVINDQTLLGWAMNEVFGKRLCYTTWSSMVTWAYNPPKEKK